MAKRGKYNRRRRQGSLSGLYKLLIFVVICSAIAVALALFFKIESITITGNERYSSDEILASSGISTGDNMFLMNKYNAADGIITALPYVESVQISRQMPGGLTISVSECSAPAAVRQGGQLWLLSAAGKVVDSKNAAEWGSYLQVTGLTLLEPQVGQMMVVSEEENDSRLQLQKLLPLLKAKDMLSDTQAIDLSDGAEVTLRYLDRFDVTFRRDADFDYKLDYLLAVVERLEVNETGSIDMTLDDKASFIPGPTAG